MSPPSPWSFENQRLWLALLAELLEREEEALEQYVPLPKIVAFHECLYGEVAISGANRSSKTTSASVDVAAAATGRHWIEGKWPDPPLQIACIGHNERHLALMFKYLFDKPPVKIFNHPDTGKVTLVIPDLHKKYKKLWRHAKPLIPERYFKESREKAIAWKSEKELVPSQVNLKNGTEIKFYSALSHTLPAGFSFDLVWIDEEIMNAEHWLSELRPRLQDTVGRIIWSATPQRATQEFFEFQTNAEDPKRKDWPDHKKTGFFHVVAADNIYLPKEGREAFESRVSGLERQIRVEGKSYRELLAAYPMWDRDIHVVPPIKQRFADTRYLIFDPGVKEAGVLFVIAPEIITDPAVLETLHPEELKYRHPSRKEYGCLVVYDEIIINNATPQAIAVAVKEHLYRNENRQVRELIIDFKGGKGVHWKGMKVGQTPEGIYMDHLKAVGIEAIEPGWGYGSHDRKAGYLKTMDYLYPQDDGLPALFVCDNCEQTKHEFKSHRKKLNAKGEAMEEYEEANRTLLDCVRYATTRGVQWHPPPQPTGPKRSDRKEFENTLNNMRARFLGQRR